MGDEMETVVIDDPAAVLKSLEKANKEAKRYREERDALQERINNDANKARAIKAEAKLALLHEGIKEPDRLVKYLSLNDLDFDDEGNLSGFDESLTALRTDMPELFDPKRRAKGIDAHAQGDVAQKTTTEQQVDRLFAK